MSRGNALWLVVAVLGFAALAVIAGGCASLKEGGGAAGGRIPYAIDKGLAAEWYPAEDQVLTERDRQIYQTERRRENTPRDHEGTNGTYKKTAAEEGKIWHWGI